IAQFFLTLLDRFKGLAAGAYFLVAWIGLKLVGSGIHDAVHPIDASGAPLELLKHRGWRAQLPDWVETFPWEMHDLVFWPGMATIVVLSLIYKPRNGTSDHLHGREQDSGESSGPTNESEVAGTP